MATRLVQLDIYRTAIPMRSFEHAAAGSDLAEAIVVRAGFSDGGFGWGETLPRAYVTGETLETVVSDLQQVLWPAAAGADFCGASGALEAIPATAGDGRRIHAAACALELACVDWLLRREGRAVLAGLLGRVGLAAPIRQRITGVLGSSDPAKTARRLRLMWWFGLRDYKLKLGLGEDVDGENLRIAAGRLAKAIPAGRATLRVDVNGGWSAAETPARAEALAAAGVCAIEQPVYGPAGELADLAGRCRLPLVADESLVSEADAEALLAAGRKVWWNVRISKNGGLVRSGRLLGLAAEHGVTAVLGCMVGESGILSAAQRRLLEASGGGVRFVEGNYGRLLLADDLTRPSPRFGYGGRLGVLGGPGLGVEVLAGKLRRYGRLLARLGT